MKVIIKTIKGHSYTLEISGENLILDLKKEYAKMINKTDYTCIRFKYDGQVLRDNKTLNYYGIEDEDLILAVENSRIG